MKMVSLGSGPLQISSAFFSSEFLDWKDRPDSWFAGSITCIFCGVVEWTGLDLLPLISGSQISYG